MDLIQQGLIPQNSENNQEWFTPASVAEYQMTDHAVACFSGSRTPPVHKASQCRFLTWVAYTRNLARKTSAIQRCTCPMVGCELQFDRPEFMLLHVQTCPRLSKGVYRCFESGKEEKIGKCDTEGCQELKGRIVAAVNSSLKSVRRHFSVRRSKSGQFAESDWEESVVLPENSKMDAIWDQPNFAELPFDGTAIVHEMDNPWPPVPHRSDKQSSSFGLSELGVNENSMSASNNHYYGQHFPLEVGRSNDAGCFPKHQLQSRSTTAGPNAGFDPSSVPTYAQRREVLAGMDDNALTHCLQNTVHAQAEPAELSAASAPIWIGRSVLQQSEATLSSSRPRAEERADELQATLIGASFPYQSSCQITQSLATNESTAETLGDELAYSVSPAEYDPIFTNLHRVSRMVSDSSQYSEESQSIFSTESTMSSRNSSMSRLDSSMESLPNCHETPTMFFGDSNMMCDEPESIEPLSFSPRHNMSSAQPVDSNGVSIDDYVQPSCYSLNSQHLEYLPQTQTRCSRKPTQALQMPSLADKGNQSSPAKTSPSIQIPVLRRGACKYCSFVSGNKSRHEKTCPHNPSPPKRFPCSYRGCSCSFTRADNLKVHQRAQNHLDTVEFQRDASAP